MPPWRVLVPRVDAKATRKVISQRWLAAVVMVDAVLMDKIDITNVNATLPTIGRDLAAGVVQDAGS